jgi:hypothetical protein
MECMESVCARHAGATFAEVVQLSFERCVPCNPVHQTLRDVLLLCTNHNQWRSMHPLGIQLECSWCSS